MSNGSAHDTSGPADNVPDVGQNSLPPLVIAAGESSADRSGNEPASGAPAGRLSPRPPSSPTSIGPYGAPPSVPPPPPPSCVTGQLLLPSPPRRSSVPTSCSSSASPDTQAAQPLSVIRSSSQGTSRPKSVAPIPTINLNTKRHETLSPSGSSSSGASFPVRQLSVGSSIASAAPRRHLDRASSIGSSDGLALPTQQERSSSEARALGRHAERSLSIGSSVMLSSASAARHKEGSFTSSVAGSQGLARQHERAPLSRPAEANTSGSSARLHATTRSLDVNDNRNLSRSLPAFLNADSQQQQKPPSIFGLGPDRQLGSNLSASDQSPTGSEQQQELGERIIRANSLSLRGLGPGFQRPMEPHVSRTSLESSRSGSASVAGSNAGRSQGTMNQNRSSTAPQDVSFFHAGSPSARSKATGGPNSPGISGSGYLHSSRLIGFPPPPTKQKQSSMFTFGPFPTRIRTDQIIPDWRTRRERLADRGQHLLDSGLWSDCEFIVGLHPNIKVFHCHKLFLAMASPVFEAMFFGGLAETSREIKISDVQPETFRVMLDYIYTDYLDLSSFEIAFDLCYAAKKYMMPELFDECTIFLWRDLDPRNACRAYEFAKLFEESILLEKAVTIMIYQTAEVVSEPTWDEVEHTTLLFLLRNDCLCAPEIVLFDAIDKWAEKECERRGVESTPEKKRSTLGEVLFLIRYLTLTAAEFASGPAKSGLLTQQESFAILMNISCPGSWDLPKYMKKIALPRYDPSTENDADMELGTKMWCKRAMMQEPHSLNTSILDCSVTFTVDNDVWIHGIEVPSQVTDVPDFGTGMENLASAAQSPEGYNELLYAHLLDSEGTRLTYTHFTAKVNWNSMIEICFNRAVKITANNVYRIGIVLNKVGWYPMGVCTRRVNAYGHVFTFCVGQPNDTQRDGLIRSIIFSR